MLYYFDRCNTFDEFSKLLQWFLKSKFGILYMSHIIDDFMFFRPANSAICQKYLDLFIKVSEYLRIPIKHQKTYNASTCLELHGIKVCTETMTASLPKEKIQKAMKLIDNMLQCSKTDLKSMQELCRFFNFCLRIIPSAQFFH